jgi:hypothetical protein
MLLFVRFRSLTTSASSISFDVHFVRMNSYTFLELLLAGIYGLCMNSMVYYVLNNNLYDQYIPKYKTRRHYLPFFLLSDSR